MPDLEKLRAVPSIIDHLVGRGICSRCGAGPKPLYNAAAAVGVPAFGASAINCCYPALISF